MKRLLVSSPKGGCGKTTIARNLAVAAVRDGFSVATADLDPQRTLTRWSRRRTTINSLPQLAHYEVDWNDADALTEDGAIEPADLLVIDTPPSIEANPAEMKRLVMSADLIIVPTRASLDDVESAAPYLISLRTEGAAAVAVLNFSKPRVNTASERAIILRVAELAPVDISDRTDFNRAGGKGLALVDVDGHPGGAEVEALYEYIRLRLWGGRQTVTVAPAANTKPTPKTAKLSRGTRRAVA